jgi:predicted flavoprotein YhiN
MLAYSPHRSPAHASTAPSHVAIIGGGPAGLMAAEVLSQAGARVDLYDGMPSVGRKFLLAGVGGMNITHPKPTRRSWRAMPNAHRRSRPAARLRRRALCQWIHGLGIDTFVGTSGRVFPTDMKAAPLLRAWLKRLRDRAWLSTPAIAGWAGTNGGLRIHSPEGEKTVQADAVLLALGGGSWARLGSDGAWMRHWSNGVCAPLQPSNCGFEVRPGAN